MTYFEGGPFTYQIGNNKPKHILSKQHHVVSYQNHSNDICHFAL